MLNGRIFYSHLIRNQMIGQVKTYRGHTCLYQIWYGNPLSVDTFYRKLQITEEKLDNYQSL